MSDEVTTKSELLDLIEDEHQALEAVLGRLDAEQMVAPALDLGWCVKDVLAHITAWEQLMLEWTGDLLHGREPDRPAPGEDAPNWDIDGFNSDLYEMYRDKSLKTIRTAYNASYREVLDAMTNLTQADLFDPDRFTWRNGDPLWHMVGGNTFWHYREHREDIEARLLSDQD